MPNLETFPLRSVDLTLKDGTVLKLGADRMNMALQYSETVRKKESFAALPAKPNWENGANNVFVLVKNPD